MPTIDWPALLAGLLLCFMGWSLYWVGIHLAGATIGTVCGLGAAYGGASLAGLEPEQTRIAFVVAGAGGFLGGLFFMRSLHRFFFFFVGALLGTAAGQYAYIWSLPRLDFIEGRETLCQVGFIVIGTLVGGAGMVCGSRWVVALVTSVSGAFLVVFSIDDSLALIGFIPLVATSFFLQIGVLRRLSRKSEGGDKEEEE